ncbi:MAG: type II toxin-antitoxin system VapC family toxin [Geminicoccaceae bacterium]
MRRRQVGAAAAAPERPFRLRGMLDELPIVADRAPGARALHETMSLAREHRLTAAYLELAMRPGLPLATGDRNQGATAERAGIVLLLGRAQQRGRSPAKTPGGSTFRPPGAASESTRSPTAIIVRIELL